jgi:signal transduction histidine kinase
VSASAHDAASAAGRWPRGGLSTALALLVPVALVVLLHLIGQPVAAPPDDRIRVYDTGMRVDDASLEPPSTGGAPTRLPYSQRRAADGPGGAVWFTVPFALPEAARVPHALLVNYRPAVVVYLDGELLEQTSPSELLDRGDLHFQLGSRRLLVNVPPSLLHAGPHAFHVRVGAPGYDGAALSALQFGPAADVARLEAATRVIDWSRASVAGGAVLLGAFLVIAWAMVRREWIYGLAGVNCLLIGLLLSPALLPGSPLPAPVWRAVLDAADLASKALLLVLVSQFAGRDYARLRPWFFGALALGLAFDVTAALQQRPWTDFSHPWPWWALASRGALLAAAAALAVRAAARHGGGSALAAATAVVLGGLLWAYVTGGVLLLGRGDVLDFNFVGYGALVLVIAVLLQRRYVASLRREQDSRAELERLVGERTRQLEAQHLALRESERLRHAAAERERLLQDMHDGLGSRLVAAKMTAQRTDLAPQTVVRLFDECLQELRLTVDSLSVTDGDLTLLLANLRHRLGPRLADAGLALEWRVEDTPPVAGLAGVGARDLVRIVEEALGNVMHHAGATRVRIETSVARGRVSVVIADDGRGVPPNVREGRGLGNMRTRAARIGAAIEWRAAPGGGTEVRLDLPIESGVGNAPSQC